jgi:hypothetical protein
LTWRSRALPEEGNERLAHQAQTVLKKENSDSKLDLFATSFANEVGVSDVFLKDLFKKGYIADNSHDEVQRELRTGQKQDPNITLAESTEQDGCLYYQGAKYVPNHHGLCLKII